MARGAGQLVARVTRAPKWVDNVWRRPFEVLVSCLVLLVGVSQAIFNSGYPEGMEGLPDWSLRMYGAYVLVASAGWLWGVVAGSPLVERAALTALSTAFFVVVAAEIWVGEKPSDIAQTVITQLGLGSACAARASWITAAIRRNK